MKGEEVKYKTVIILASTVKEAKQIANAGYLLPEYLGPHHYSKGKGNNFYKFKHYGDK